MKQLLITLVIFFSILGGTSAGVEGIPMGENHTSVELFDQRPPV